MIRKSYFKFAALLSMCIAVSCSDDDPGKGGGGKSEVKVPENAVDLSAAGTANCYIVKPGGTVAVFMAERNIDTLDAGVPVLSMHAPFETVSKLDCYETYKGMKAVFQAEK